MADAEPPNSKEWNVRREPPMVALVDSGASARRWRIVADGIRSDISAGRFVPGARLPSREELARQFQVSGQTVQTAIERLRDEGYVVSRRGQGWFVRDHSRVRLKRSSERWMERNAHLLPSEEAQPLDVERHVRFDQANAQIAADLRIERRAPVVVKERRVHHNGEVLHVGSTYLPREITRGTPLEEKVAEDGTYPWLTRCGHRPVRFIELVAIGPASEAEAQMLGLDPTRPPTVIKISRVAHSASRPVEVDYLVAPAGGLQLVYELPAHD